MIPCTFWKYARMSFVRATPRVGNKILVPLQYSHTEEKPEDEYFMLMDMQNFGDGECYSVTKLIGGKNGIVSVDPDDTLHIDLDEFYMFREFFILRK